MLRILLTFAAALLPGLLLLRMKVPGGMMIGAVVGACAFGLATGHGVMPPAAKTAAQILAGALIGSFVSRDEIQRMRMVIKPALILLPTLLAVNLACGFLMAATGEMDLITAFMASTPGGISNIPMIAVDLGADPAKVLVLQFVRFFMGIALFPSIIRLLEGREPASRGATKGAREKPSKRVWPFLLTLLTATVCGLIGDWSPLPSGTMAFATLGAMALKYGYAQAYTPRAVGRLAQCLSGAYVGAGIGWAELHALLRLPLPVGILLSCYVVGGGLLTFFFVKTGCFARKEAMLAATPAGASDMALISADLGVYNAKLVVLQVLRLIVVITVFPAILSAVAALFGGG